MKTRFVAVLLLLAVCLLPGNLTRSSRSLAAPKPEGEWFFVVVETHVHQKAVPTSDAHPEERRWYVSSLTQLPDSIPDYSEKKKSGEFFDANVVEPAKARGLLVDYYDSDMSINGGSVNAIQTRQQGEDLRNKEIEALKTQGGNVYSFDIDFAASKGEATSNPKLVYRDKAQPSYDGAGKAGGR